MDIKDIDISLAKLWSELWQIELKNSEGPFRGIEEEYFKSKYLNIDESKGRCCYFDDEVIAFWGEIYSKEDGIRIVSICDFIIKEKYRGNGVLKKIINELFEQMKSKVDLVMFYPINRQAMISWKFTINPKISNKYFRWAIDLEELDIEKRINTIEIKKINTSEKGKIFNSKFYEWRYIKYYNNQHLFNLYINNRVSGFMSLKEIEFKRYKGIEIEKLEMKNIGDNYIDIFLQVFKYCKENKYKFIIFKVSEYCEINDYLNSLKNIKKVNESKYSFVINFNNKVYDSVNNQSICDEDIDIPRDYKIIKGLYKVGE